MVVLLGTPYGKLPRFSTSFWVMYEYVFFGGGGHIFIIVLRSFLCSWLSCGEVSATGAGVEGVLHFEVVLLSATVRLLNGVSPTTLGDLGIACALGTNNVPFQKKNCF